MAVHAEIENLGWSIVRSPPGESSPKQAAKAGGWVSGEEFYTYVQPGGPGLTVFMSFYLELLSTTFQLPILPQGKPLSPFNSPSTTGPYVLCSHPSIPCSVPPSPGVTQLSRHTFLLLCSLSNPAQAHKESFAAGDCPGRSHDPG